MASPASRIKSTPFQAGFLLTPIQRQIESWALFVGVPGGLGRQQESNSSASVSWLLLWLWGLRFVGVLRDMAEHALELSHLQAEEAVVSIHHGWGAARSVVLAQVACSEGWTPSAPRESPCRGSGLSEQCFQPVSRAVGTRTGSEHHVSLCPPKVPLCLPPPEKPHAESP